MMIVNYHGFFRVHRHHYADHAAHRSNYASHCSDQADHRSNYASHCSDQADHRSNYAGRASDHSCRLVPIVTRARDLRYVGS